MADVTFTDSSFDADVLKSDLPVVIDFWAPWCAPCRIVTPIIEDLATDYAGKVKVGKMNVDDNPQTAGNFGVMSIPTILVFKGGKPVKSIVGAQGKESYKRAIDEVLSS
ncbi:MAG: thioredoxin [Candidatus Levybacteria bacterium]|nr:thioredoxin [Candidatus Levybacteria bacterium]